MRIEKKVSVVIPTHNAEKYLGEVLRSLQIQSKRPDEILVIDSESEDRTLEIAEEYGARTFTVEKKTYDHGGTRNLGVYMTTGDYILFLSHDATPVNEFYVEKLVAPMEKQEAIAMVSGRQVAREDATPIEKYTREFNYPDRSNARDKKDIPKMGIKTFFFSDVCSAYRRSTFEELGGFPSPIITNEDMYMAVKAIEAGYKVAYEAQAKVLHSHNFTRKQQEKRNFDVSVFMTMYADLFQGIPVMSEGMKMVRYVERKLIFSGHFLQAISYIFYSAAKLKGNRAGKRYESMTKEQILERTSNPGYWQK